MRQFVIAACILLAVLVSDLACREQPPAKDGIAFGLPFLGSEEGETNEDWCLADVFKSGLPVVMVGPGGTCRAKTGAVFIYPFLVDDPFKATRMEDKNNCLRPTDKEKAYNIYRVAVVGANPSAVRVVPAQPKVPSLSQGTLAQARRILQSADTPYWGECAKGNCPVDYNGTTVLEVGRVSLLLFKAVGDDGDGPSLILVDGELFPLEGWVTGGHVFFTVQFRLHVAYYWADTGSGQNGVRVYDLSEGAPKLVYSNDIFST